MFIVVAYDMPDTRRRTRLFKTMKGFGVHTQFSVFECELTEKDLARMLSKIAQVIDPGEDNVKVYTLCKACLGSIHLIGAARLVRKPQAVIV
ncbi:MAG: CRISPR-associated endonuclease Cas2 [Geobacteraceae bacterium]|nr:CRISPR-associated endonuclease Cas2 [Geobacteraceae bacterium]